jgi:endonuclease VIII
LETAHILSISIDRAFAGVQSLQRPVIFFPITDNNMPEGHTIHRAARDQSKVLAGQTLQVSSPQGRFEAGAAAINGRVCTAIDAYGKHLIYRFDNDQSLHIHLGLFGTFRTAKCPAPKPRGAVRVRMVSATHVVDINGPNTCEVLDSASLARVIGRIGPDVLRQDADPELVWTRISKSRSSIGQLLMDQSVIAGIGNIYRSEILWRQKVHPLTPGQHVCRASFERLWADAVRLLAIGVKHNAIITVDGGRASKLRYGERVNIFNKTRCPICVSEINIFEIAGRRAFACEMCQPRN